MAGKVGDAWIQVHANGKDVPKEIKKIGDDVGKEFEKSTDSIQKNLARMNARMISTSRGFDKLFKGERDPLRRFSEDVKRAFNKGVLIAMKDGQNGALQFAHGLGVVSESMDKIKSKGELAADAFQKLQRRGYTAQTAIGILGASIGDLAMVLTSAVGVIAAAAPSLLAVGAAGVSIGAGFIAAKIAMTGVSSAAGALWKSQTALNDTFRAAKQEFIGLKFAAEDAALSEEDASIRLEKAREALARVQDLPPDNRLRRETELQYKQADLAYRKAKHTTEESFRAVKKGITATSAYQPLAGLTQSQLAFTIFLVKLRPLIKSLEEAVAKSFLPKLQQGINTVVKYGLPTIGAGFTALGSAMGDATKTFANVFKDRSNIIKLEAFFKNSEPTVRKLGSTLSHTFGGLLALLQALNPLTVKFTNWVNNSMANWEKKMKFQNATGHLQNIFKLAGDVAGRLGGIFKNIFDGVGNIAKAAFPSGARSGAGGVLLTWLESVTKGWRDFSKDTGFADMFKQATTNGTTALSTIGQLLKVFVELAGKKETEQFWIVLRDAVPNIKKLLDDGAKMGPIFAQTLVSFTDMLAALSDTGVLRTFFNTLNVILKIVVGILKFLKPVLDVLGLSHGAILAVVLGLLVIKKVFMVILGYFIKGANAVGAMAIKMDTFSTNISKTNRLIKWQGQALYDYNKRALGPLQKIKILMGVISRESKNNLKKQLLEQAAAAGASEAKLKALNTQMMRNITAGKRLTAGTGMAGRLSGGIGGGRLAGAGMAVGLAASSLGDMANSGGMTASGGLMAAGGIASMFGPGGMVAGAVLGIAGAITQGFEQADAQRKEALKQINIQVATINVAKQAVNKENYAAIATAGLGLNTKQISEAVTQLSNTAEDLFTTKIGKSDAFKSATDVGKVQTIFLNSPDLVKTFSKNSELSKQLTVTAAKFANFAGISGTDAATGIANAISAKTGTDVKSALSDLGFDPKALKSLDLSGLKSGTDGWTKAINKFISSTPGLSTSTGVISGAKKVRAQETTLTAEATGSGNSASNIFDKSGNILPGSEAAQRKYVTNIDAVTDNLSKLKLSLVPWSKAHPGMVNVGGPESVMGLTIKGKTYEAGNDLNNAVAKILGLKNGQFDFGKFTKVVSNLNTVDRSRNPLPGLGSPGSGPTNVFGFSPITAADTAARASQQDATSATKDAAKKLHLNTDATNKLVGVLSKGFVAATEIPILTAQWAGTTAGRTALAKGGSAITTSFNTFLKQMGYAVPPQ